MLDHFSKSRAAKTIFLLGLTAGAIVLIEWGRRTANPVPAPFLLLYVSVVLSAGLGGIPTGVSSGVIAALFVMHSGMVGFGPPTLIGGATQVTIGALLYIGTGVFVGRLSDQRRTILFDKTRNETELVAEVLKKTNALRENENLLDSIFLNVPVGLVIKNREHVVERVNRTYRSWYGREAEIQIGTRADLIRDYQSAEDAKAMNAQEDEVAATGRTLTRQVERKLVDGEIHILNIIKFPVYDQNNIITKIGSVSVELTDLVAAKRHAEKALMQAELANRTKSALLANMSHELRTPLNAIIGFSEILLAQVFGPLGAEKYVEQVKAIHWSGHHLLDLVNDILDMAKIESEEYELSPEELTLNELVADTIQLVIGTADRKNIKLRKQLPQPIPIVIADKRAMKQILLNLVSNAVKFTPDGGWVSVTMSVVGENLQIVVEDNGIGIPAQEIPKITKPFYQGSRNSRHASGEGTGLGLSIVASLIQRHQAKLDIQSELGKGTRVSVTLPCVLRKTGLRENS